MVSGLAGNPHIDAALDAILEASTDNAGSFTCSEADRVADLFAVAGRRGDGEEFLSRHGDEDSDPEDLHVGHRYRELMFWDDGVTVESEQVLVFAEHRRARGEGAVYGPYADGYAARWEVAQRYRSGDFDSDGCEVTFKRGAQR